MKKMIIFSILVLLFLPYKAFAGWATDSSVNTPVVTAEDSQGHHRILHDGKRGYFAVWADCRNSLTTGSDIYAQYFNSAGNPQWGENGMAVCNAGVHQAYPKVILDGDGGIIVSWEDYRGGSNAMLYAQKITANGVPQWTANGVPVLSTPGTSHECGWMAPDGSGGAYIISNTQNGWINRVDASGSTPWAGPVSLNSTYKIDAPKIMADGLGNAICAWVSEGGDDGDTDRIQVQKIDSNGNCVWNSGSPIDLNTYGWGFCPRLVSDGSNGAIVIWENETGEDTGIFNIYVQKVSSSGTLQWNSGVEVLITSTADESSLGLASDGAGGAFATWVSISDGNVYARRLSTGGSPGSTIQLTTTGGCGVSDSPRKTAEDGSGGFITTWKDNNGNVRSQRVDSGSNPVWPAGGIVLSDASGAKGCPRIDGTNKGGGAGIWNFRSGATSFYSDTFSDGPDAWWWEASGDDTWHVYVTPSGATCYLGYIAGETMPVAAALANRELSNYKILLFTLIGINAQTPGTRSTGVFFGGDDPEEDFERFAAQIHFDNDGGESAYYFQFAWKEYDPESGETDVTMYYNQELSNYTKGESYAFAMGVEQMGPGYSGTCSGDDCVGVQIWDYSIHGFTPPSAESSFIYTTFEVDNDDLYDSGSVGLETDSPGAYYYFEVTYYTRDIYIQGVKPNGKLGSPFNTSMAAVMLQLLN